MIACATPEARKLFHEGTIALAEVEHNGIKVDVDYLDKAIQSAESQIKDLNEQMEDTDTFKLWRKIFGRKTNLGSPDQLGRIVYKELGYPILERTEKGKPKVDADALADIDLPFIQLWVQAAKLKKASGGFLAGIKRETDENGFLHSFYNLNIPESYRSSCDSPNFQNYPIRDPAIGKLVRTCFIPRRKKWQIVEVDFSGVEVKMAAVYTQDPVLVKYVKDKTTDMHRDTAVQMFLLKPDQVSKSVRHVSKNKFVFPQFYGDWYKSCAVAAWKEIRRGKLTLANSDVLVIDHLAKKGIKELGACDPERDAKRGTFEYHLMEIEKDFWKRRFRVYDAWKNKIWKAYQEKGHMKSHTGFVYQGNLSKKQVTNFGIQGSSFHCLLWSLIQIRKELKRKKMRTLLIGQIHDSVVADVAPGELEDYLQIVKRITTEDLLEHWKFINVPMEVEAGVAPPGASWYEKKEAKL